MNVSKKPRIKVTAAIIANGGQFLICQRPKNKSCGLLWEFPGGKIEQGETPEECIARECNEELNIELQSIKQYCNVTYEYDDKIVELSFLTASIDNRNSMQPNEHNDVAWIKKNDLSNYSFCPADQKMLTEYGLPS